MSVLSTTMLEMEQCISCWQRCTKTEMNRATVLQTADFRAPKPIMREGGDMETQLRL